MVRYLIASTPKIEHLSLDGCIRSREAAYKPGHTGGLDSGEARRSQGARDPVKFGSDTCVPYGQPARGAVQEP